AGGRGLHSAQKGIGDLGDLATAIAGRTGLIGHPLGLELPADLDFLFDPMGHLIQGHLYPDAQIAPLGPGLSAPKAAKTAESTAKGTSEDIPELAEDILHVHAAAKS